MFASSMLNAQVGGLRVVRPPKSVVVSAGREEPRSAPTSKPQRPKPSVGGSGSKGGRPQRKSPANDRTSSATDSVKLPHPTSGFLRIFDTKIPFVEDPGKDSLDINQALLNKLSKKLKSSKPLEPEWVKIARKSFDARKGKLEFSYVVDLDMTALTTHGVRVRVAEEQGKVERVDRSDFTAGDDTTGHPSSSTGGGKRDPVVVVGCGPAGLFAALAAAEEGLPVILIERGQPVEARGADIGRLMVRRQLNSESNLCYGEGGAGTWSDGKLTTRIGRNSEEVRHVLQTLYRFGAPESILVAGKPHLGTDRLVVILRTFREYLAAKGVEIRFGTRVDDLLVDQAGHAVTGVRLQGGEEIKASAVVLAIGHSARALYRRLVTLGADMTAKPFAMGFRIEHPQDLINQLQYGVEAAGLVRQGKGVLPVADYRLAAEVSSRRDQVLERLAEGTPDWGERVRPATDIRSVFSFCMCPGGQIVPTSCKEDELCINGMSFSRRNSKWANSALVAGIVPEDWAEFEAEHGVLAGVALQEAIERKAAVMGGGNLRCPAQRVVDFMEGRQSAEPLPPSSYRLGVTSARCDQIYSESVTEALRNALQRFDRSLPGFASCPEALLHGVETRTSAPVRIERDDETLQSTNLKGLYPTGEGAGWAGGIVSAAVDGFRVGNALVEQLTGKVAAVSAGEGATKKKRPSAASLTY